MKIVDFPKKKGGLAEIKASMDRWFGNMGEDSNVLIIYTDKDDAFCHGGANITIPEAITFLEFCKYDIITEGSEE